MSNKGLNSNEALHESTATNSSVTLSGIRRMKETPDGLDIEDYRPDHRKCELEQKVDLNVAKRQRSAAYAKPTASQGGQKPRQNMKVFIHAHLTILAGRDTRNYGP